MDVVGSEIGQKMRSAIKAKLTELGCYVDDELPDYVMVMVANKRTRAQMEEDLQLFLGDNTELFVNWLHQVLKKLQEVTIPPIAAEPEKPKDKTKEKKPKEKKQKGKVKEKVKKAESGKKTKKKDKDKLRKKEEKKSHKSKKKSKHEMIRPNIPPLLMNIEKESEPSITDVFAGQILKNHGITIDISKEEAVVDKKPDIVEPKRPILPIIDPATISSQAETEPSPTVEENRPNITIAAPREEQIKEIDEIEAKILGLKQKLAEQLDSMSDDEDFLNIRTEAEELMNDFAEDVFQEISSQAPPVETPSVQPMRTPSPATLPSPPKTSEPKELPKEPPQELPKDPPKEIELPQIELKLPKRPIRERLGARGDAMKVLEDPQVSTTKKIPDVSTTGKEKEAMRTETPERFTPDREPDFWGKLRPAKRRLGDPPETSKRRSKSESEGSDKSETSSSKQDTDVKRRRGVCASVVRVRPRPRAAPSLLLRAVADAQRSLLSIPPKIEGGVKRALVLPMRRAGPAGAGPAAGRDLRVRIDNDTVQDHPTDKMGKGKEEYIPALLTKKITNTEYMPSRRPDRSATMKDDTLVVETINIHSTTVDKDKKTQFIVTMDGFNPNAFLAKKLKTEGLLDDEAQSEPAEIKSVLKTALSVRKSTENENSLPKSTEAEKPVLISTEAEKSVPKWTEPEEYNILKTIDAEKSVSKRTEAEKTVSKRTEAEKSISKSTEAEKFVSKRTEAEKYVSKRAEAERSVSKRAEAEKFTSKWIETENLAPKRTETENSISKTTELTKINVSPPEMPASENKSAENDNFEDEKNVESPTKIPSQKKRLSDTSHTSDESDTQVIINSEEPDKLEKRKVTDVKDDEKVEKPPSLKRRKSSPIVFDMKKKDELERTTEGKEVVERKRERTESASSDSHVVVTTTTNSHKYDTLPSLTAAERKLVWCRAFPSCRYGAACAFQHPRCRFAAACTRRACVYAHAAPPAPALASHVVPAANYKTISGAVPSVCKYYPNCANPTCHYYHPKPCRYGKACANKLECNFYHNDVPSKWRFPAV